MFRRVLVHTGEPYTMGELVELAEMVFERAGMNVDVEQVRSLQEGRRQADAAANSTLLIELDGRPAPLLPGREVPVLRPHDLRVAARTAGARADRTFTTDYPGSTFRRATRAALADAVTEVMSDAAVLRSQSFERSMMRAEALFGALLRDLEDERSRLWAQIREQKVEIEFLRTQVATLSSALREVAAPSRTRFPKWATRAVAALCLSVAGGAAGGVAEVVAAAHAESSPVTFQDYAGQFALVAEHLAACEH